MSWIYKLTLTEYRDAGTVQSDWQSIAGEQIAHDLGGVTVSGTRAVVVSTPREPNYADMGTFDYVTSVSEHKEIPGRESEDFDPPISLGHGIDLVE